MEEIFYSKVFPLILEWEGVSGDLYFDDYKVPETVTKFGIRFDFNEKWLKSIGIDHPEKLANLDIDDARVFYFQKFLKSKASIIFNVMQRLSFNYFDCAFNGGEDDAVQCLQVMINRYDGVGLKVDGVWGPKTTEGWQQVLKSGWCDNSLCTGFIRARNELIESRWANKNKRVFRSLTKRYF